MSIDDIPIADGITEHLRDLLSRAHDLKPNTSIDPPLPSSSLLDESIRAIKPTADSDLPQSRLHAAFETSARNLFYSLLASSDISSPSFVSVWNLLDITGLCADHGLCDSSLALWLVEELLDSQTIEGCRRVFDYLESRRERLLQGNSRNKQMIVLRSCNELLRRLSRAEDAVFCGRVFIFLFQSFPLGDKSAVNLRGEFHTENVTAYEETLSEAENGEAMDVDNEIGQSADTAGKADANKPDGDGGLSNGNGTATSTIPPLASSQKDTGTTVTAIPQIKEPTSQPEQKHADNPELSLENFYPTFWSLQSLFSNPTRLFDPETLTNFKTGLELTLRKFKSLPHSKTHRPVPSSASSRSLKRKASAISDDKDTGAAISTFTPKYLTTPALLPLQLVDPTFQRHILVQSLITLNFLLSLTPTSKSHLVSSLPSGLKPQKATTYPFTLLPVDQAWATALRREIANYLQDGPDGKFYYRMVGNILDRDRNWVRWKAESCPSIALPRITAESAKEAMDGAKRACAPRRVRAQVLGGLDLGFLTDDPKEGLYSLDSLRTSDTSNSTNSAKNTTKHLLSQISTLDQEISALPPDDSQAQILEKAHLRDQRSCTTWRALRLGRRNRLRVFGRVEEGKGVGLLDENVEAEEDRKIAEKEREKEREKEEREREEERRQADADKGEGKAEGEQAQPEPLPSDVQQATTDTEAPDETKLDASEAMQVDPPASISDAQRGLDTKEEAPAVPTRIDTDGTPAPPTASLEPSQDTIFAVKTETETKSVSPPAPPDAPADA